MLLDVMSQLGMLLVIVGVTPTLLNNSDIPVLDVFGKKVRVHRFLSFVPVGISLVLLSLRPSLAEARYVVLAAFVFLGVRRCRHRCLPLHCVQKTPALQR